MSEQSWGQPHGESAGGYGQVPAAQGAPYPPPTNAGWAVAAVLFFWPIAFSAFTHSSNVMRLWAIGDYAGAQYASTRARELGRIALFVWLGIMVLVVVFYVIVIVSIVSTANSYNGY